MTDNELPAGVQALPTDAGAMAQLIDGRIDPELLTAVAEARRIAQLAQAQLQACQQDLTAHLATSPEDEPLAWVRRQRELLDLQPVLESVLRAKMERLHYADGELKKARGLVAHELQEQLRRATNGVRSEMFQKARELKDEVERLERYDFEPWRQVSARRRALDRALSALGATVYDGIPI